MSINDELKIKIVLEKKEELLQTTNKISEVLKDLGKGSHNIAMLDKLDGKNVDSYYTLNNQDSLIIRKLLQNTFSIISTIAGFCDKSSQEYVMNLASMYSKISSKSEITFLEGKLLETFCVMINSLIVNFDKSPFSFSGQFKAGLKNFFADFKATFERK